ncbi:lactonase family protein [Epilithonimonas lactis]|uniref:6-phosphogluconolactonase n=1 Tax=Epilithonimonas lactis TaxID=421072 RepID=A0A085BJE3_9FLAO|nr:lactonase family protein [Epilithonimonas lactis]KFC22588.1 6-phosphogluconolactonase [Epilithonimonas lactis]SEQ81265.1 6-phosphogluconolactonase, cycloisomerase 2 family [Epilithonimonas lactis]
MTIKRLSFLFIVLIYNTVFSQREFVFFGSYNWDKGSEAVYVYELDTESGKLTKVASSSDVINPGYITVSNDGKYVYASSDAKMPSGTVSAFAFDADKKTLTFLNQQKTGGENPVYVNVDKSGKWLINATYNIPTISVFPILDNGKIDSIAQHFTFTEGSGVDPKRQDKAHTHSAVFSPDYKTVLIADLGADKILQYPFDATQKQPLIDSQSTFINTKPGSGPRHITFSKDGKLAYSIEELAGMISVYDFSENKLKEIQRVATHTDKIKEGFESSDVHISPDGKFLYASNRGKENNIAIFKIKEDGTLESIGYQSVKGKHPRTFAIDETGKFIIVTNVNSQNVTVFKRNLETGLLKKVGKPVAIKNVTCVKTKMY